MPAIGLQVVGTRARPVLDQNLALRRAELLGFTLPAVTLLLPWIAAGLAEAAAADPAPDPDPQDPPA